jgi:RNA polymerase sigma factor (sigma-70 family)
VSASPERDLDEVTGLALAARDGDRAALEELCRAVQQPMYRLALRFCGNPADAEDAAQEVLIRLVTNLGSFEGRSRFTTWAYTVAVRQLLRTARRGAEATVAGPETFGAFIDRHVADPAYDPASRVDYQELCADVRLSCTYGMLLCLSRDQRVAYLLGDLLGFSDAEAAEICEVSRAAFRRRLARARAVMRTFMGERCGLVRAGNPCRCDRLVRASIDCGLLDPSDPRWARHRGVTPADRDDHDRRRGPRAGSRRGRGRGLPQRPCVLGAGGRVGRPRARHPHPARRPVTHARQGRARVRVAGGG